MKNNKEENKSENLIPENWTETTLGEVATFCYGTMPKKEKIGLGIYPTFSGYKYQFLYPESNCKKGDLIVVARGVGGTGDVKIVKEDCYLTNLSIKINLDKSKAINLFLYYNYSLNNLRYLDSGSAQSQITISDLFRQTILLPPLPEQQAIAQVLSSFDDKIELLREENKTLEELGQTIFKEWFGKYSIKDELPDGWRVGKIMEIIKRELVSYKCDKKDLDSKGITPIIDQGASGLYGYTKRDPDFIATRESPVIIFTNHTCNYWFIDYPFCAIQNILPYRGKNGYDEYFLYFMTKGSITFIEYKGHWPDFEAKDFIIPPVEVSQRFTKIAKPILQKISDNNLQIKSLSRSRDELLPKLMSGEMGVKNFTIN